MKRDVAIHLKFDLDRIVNDHTLQHRDHRLQMRIHDEKLRKTIRKLTELE
jgi:hypothetical protein